MPRRAKQMIYILHAALFCSVCFYLMTEKRIKKSLRQYSNDHANDYFSDRYYDGKYSKRKSIQLKGHMLIHRSGKRKQVINLHLIESVDVKVGRFLIYLVNNDKPIKLPSAFHKANEIYTILRFHRPAKPKGVRSTLSTRISS